MTATLARAEADPVAGAAIVAEMAARQAADMLKQDVATAATDAELASALADAQAYAESIAAGGIELGYAEITSSATTQSGPPGVDVAGLALPITVGERPILITAGGYAFNTGTGGVSIGLWEDGTKRLDLDSMNLAANSGGRLICASRRTPSAGPHTYKVTMYRNTANGTATLFANDTDALRTKPFIQAIEV